MSKKLTELIAEYFPEKVGKKPSLLQPWARQKYKEHVKGIAMDLLFTWDELDLYKRLVKKLDLDESKAQAFLEEFRPYRERFLNSELGRILHEVESELKKKPVYTTPICHHGYTYNDLIKIKDDFPVKTDCKCSRNYYGLKAIMYHKLLKKVEPEYHGQLVRFVKTGNANQEFKDYLKQNKKAQKAVEMMFDEQIKEQREKEKDKKLEEQYNKYKSKQG